MKKGKVTENVLKRTILKDIKNTREEVIIGAALGEDCAVLELKEGEKYVTTTDSVAGAWQDIGLLAVHRGVNDLLAEGAIPIGILLNIVLPEDYKESRLKAIMEQIKATCKSLGIQILGGHTEVSVAVNVPVIGVTAVGKAMTGMLTLTRNAKPDMDIVITKWVGLEGTAILAKEKEAELLTRYPKALIEDAKGFVEFLSVMPEQKALSVANSSTVQTVWEQEESRLREQTGNERNVVAMHDLSQGGIFGALWELSQGANVGIDVELKKIPIRQETIEICEFFDLNPYNLTSAGAVLIVAENGYDCVAKLEEAGIPAVVIGKTTNNKDKAVRNEGETRYLEAPKTDELYKVL